MRKLLFSSALLIVFTCSVRAQGPVILVGIDTEFGQRPGNVSHGTIATWANLFQIGLLNKVTNGKSDILVIGGGKSSADMVTDFWTQIGAASGRTVVFVNGAAAISGVNLNNYAMIAVVNTVAGTGKLTQDELDAINGRRNEVTAFLCGGGALFGSACDLNSAYGYLSGTGNITGANQTYYDVSATSAGNAVGINNTNLDTGPWHTTFSSYPAYLQVLATDAINGKVAAVGGANVGGPAVAAYTLPKTQYCIDENIIANGSPSQNELNHFWSIQESDQNWNRYGPEIMDWFSGPAGTTNLTQYAASKGFAFKCDTYYRIKLAVAGLCTPWHETSKLVKITCQGATAVNLLPKTEFCLGENVMTYGTPSQNETTHFWSLQESDQNWNRYGPEVSEWFQGQAGPKSLKQFAASKGFTFKCNTYYRVVLAVSGCGSPWNATVKLFKIVCPDAGPSRQVCCTSAFPVQLGSPPISGFSYNWTSNPPGFTSTLANPTVNPTGTTTYTLTATSIYGCAYTSSVTLSCLTYPELRVDLSTGGQGGLKDPYGTPDADWLVRGVPGTLYGTNAPHAFSVKPNTQFWPYWGTNLFANWISPQVTQDGESPMQKQTAWPPDPAAIDYFYEYRFYYDLSQLVGPKIEINELAVDNDADIFLNSQVLSGNPTNQTGLGLTHGSVSNFHYMHGPYNITSGFVNGWNTLLVRVQNGGSWNDTSPTGLLIRGGFRAKCR